MGDVRPMVALGSGLKKAGYGVRIATFRTFEKFIREYGLDFAAIQGDPRKTMQGRAGQVWLESGKDPIRFFGGFRRLFSRDFLQKSFQDTAEACRGSDAVLYTPLGAAAYHAAEKMGIPKLYLMLQPLSRTREAPSMLMPSLPLGGAYNQFTHLFTEQILWQLLRGPINRWRREYLNLPPMPFWGPFNILYQTEAPFIFGYSKFVVPPPTDLPDSHHITGYWLLENKGDWSPPPSLLDFLSQDPKPIYIGFGSMSGDTARNLIEMAVEATRITDQRAVLVGGWAEAHHLELPDSMYACAYADHEWLFPQTAAVVHHGGAGTTAAGLRAGMPTVIIPFMGDQPYWGQRVHQLGVGPQPLSRKRMASKLLAERIFQAVSDSSMKQKAAKLGEKIRHEDGIRTAVRIIIKYLNGI
jgi:UDP:flavonoid glycosyltransferase YjiC (YdhE family)